MFLNELYTEKAGMSVFLQAIAELVTKAEMTVYRGAPSQMCFPDPARPDEGIRTFAVQLMDNPELDDDLRMLLARCLAVDPNDRPSLADLLDRAQRAGAVRPDLALPELVALLVGTGATLEQLGPDPAARARVLDVVFTGLRPG